MAKVEERREGCSGSRRSGFGSLTINAYDMLMRPAKVETDVHGCHCPGDMAVVLARPCVGVRVSYLILRLLTDRQ